MEKGWIKMQNSKHSKNKFFYAYLLTLHALPKSSADSQILQRKMQQYEAFRAENEALKKGVMKAQD